MSFGVNLKRERELRGITLDEIAKATKVSVRLLAAIESDRFDILPEGVFRKSFIKSYARYLGMNEEQVLQEYALQFPPSGTSSAQAEKAAKGRPAMAAAKNRPLRLWVAGVVLVVACSAIYWLLETETSPESASTPASTTSTGSAPSQAAAPNPTTSGGSVGQPPATNTQRSGASKLPRVAATPSPAPKGTASAAEAAQQPASPLKVLGELAKKPETPPATSQSAIETSPGSPLKLTIQAIEEAWVSVSASEKLLFLGFMNPEESRSFPLQSPLRIVLGNAGGVRFLVNGQTFASLGRTGERKTVELSSENYQQYLAAKPQ